MRKITFLFFVSCVLMTGSASASVGHWELRPRPFTAATNFMSLRGYYRLKQYQETGVWKLLPYDFTPVETFVDCPGNDPSLGRLLADYKFEELLGKHPDRVLFVIRYSCQAPEPGEGPMMNWNFDKCYNRFLDATPKGYVKHKSNSEITN